MENEKTISEAQFSLDVLAHTFSTMLNNYEEEYGIELANVAYIDHTAEGVEIKLKAELKSIKR